MSDWWQTFFLSGSYTMLEDIPPERTEMQADFVMRALGLASGAEVLDVACGIGRHSLALARRGIRVVGVDFTPRYLDRAAAGVGGLPARFVRGDMRGLPIATARFDAAVNLFTSFGYLADDEADAAVLREVARVIRPGGHLLIDTMNRDALADRFAARDWQALPDGFLLEERVWDSRRGRCDATWTFVRGGQCRSFATSVRTYTFGEMERMLGAAGLEVVDDWGSWEGDPVSLYASRLILKARKAT